MEYNITNKKKTKLKLEAESIFSGSHVYVHLSNGFGVQQFRVNHTEKM